MLLVDAGDVKKNIIIFVYKLYIMKKQGYNSRLDESLGAKHGKKSQSYKDRRDESKAMSKKMYDHSYGADKSMSYRHTSSWKTHDHLK